MRTDKETGKFLKELEDAIKANEELLKRTRDTAARLAAKLKESTVHDKETEELPNSIPDATGKG